MSVSGVEFLLALLAFSALFFYLPHGTVRRTALALCNAGFLYLLIPNAFTWIALAAFLLSGYAVGRRLITHPSRVTFVAYLTAMLAAFVWLKQYDFLRLVLPPHLLQHPIAIVGLSYMLFRQIHFLVDAMQGQIERATLWTYLNYQLNLFTLLSGPIQRYREFADYWRQPRPLIADRHDLLWSYQRIFLGIIKISLVAALCLSYYNSSMRGLDDAASGKFPMSRLFGVRHFLLVFYLYAAYVYFNFSGYCDIVIGAGRLVGLKMPENFDRPYLSRNMIDFWTRQHMTLSFWIRDYLFTPMYKSIAERSPQRAASLAFLCYFVALFLAGVWHGATLNFVVFGLLHGAGVSAAKLWEMTLVKRYGRPAFKKYMQSQAVRFVAIFITLHFVCFTFLFFTPDLDRKLRVMKAVLHAVV